ncbi:MAG TPA: hypothetical protein VNG33_17110 [Polyangiaceae bacterium]|nr:hypothetical protein [Polyangiaceae bacterium]
MRLINFCLGVVCAASVVSACGGGDAFNAGAGNTTAQAGAAGTSDEAGAPSNGGSASGAPTTGGTNQIGGSVTMMMGGQNPVGTGGAPPEAGAGAGGEAGAGGAPTPPECVTKADCDTTRGGPAHCGNWQCNAAGTCEIDSPGCTDADGDGYGVGANCACTGLDCDDADDTVADALQKSCYTGKQGTLGVGTCQAGQSICAAGIWGPCVGEVTPGGEACNGLDDDCNKLTDDGLNHFTCGIGACKTVIASCTSGVLAKCVPAAPVSANDSVCDGIDNDCDGLVDEDCACVHVAPTGDDTAATAAAGVTPFRNIQPAIDWAAAHPAGPQRVCVAAGAACAASFTYASAASATITMANGVSVVGRYESTTWTTCPGSTTVIQPQAAAGVTFPSSVTSPTVLGGFRVDRFNVGAGTTAGVTVDGAKNASLTDITINNLPAVDNSYAVNVINGGQASVTKSHIDAGNGSVESIGVRAVGSSVTVEDNCATFDPTSGRCTSFCGPNPSIRGRATVGTGETYAVLLDNSPGSKIQRSALCGNDADVGATIRVKGDATGLVIRGNAINAFGGAKDSHGIWLEDCAGAAPWIVDNNSILAGGTSQQTRVDAIRAIGDCHPVIDRNVNVQGGGEGNASNPTAVHCAASNNIASRCVVDGNLSLSGSSNGFPNVAAGVRCESSSCVKITNNVITGRGGVVSYGVWLGQTGAFVANNAIRGGCSKTAIGTYAEDSFARLENNRISGYAQGDCGNAGSPATILSYGLQVFTALGTNELDVHSNFVDGTGSANIACSSWGVALNVTGTPPTSPSGVFRNNILRGGVCTTARSVFSEIVDAADPRIFEHNDLDPTGSPTQLYLDQGTTALNTAAAINALVDMTSFKNISADPLFVNYPSDVHLQVASPCLAAGTSNGEPAVDMDGDKRDPTTPDIGPDER